MRTLPARCLADGGDESVFAVVLPAVMNSLLTPQGIGSTHCQLGRSVMESRAHDELAMRVGSYNAFALRLITLCDKSLA